MQGLEQIERGLCELADHAMAVQPFRAGDAVEVVASGPCKGERWAIAVYEHATDTAYIAGWPCSMVTKATQVLKLVRAATDEENETMIKHVQTMTIHDVRTSALNRVLDAGGTP